MENKQYLGRALSYPTKLIGGAWHYEQGNPLLAQSIAVLLSTPKGTKFFLPEYGSRLRELVFEPNDVVLEDLLAHFIYEAISEWEKRVSYIGTTFTRGEDVIYCTISYKILASNEIDSFVYPFYRQLKH